MAARFCLGKRNEGGGARFGRAFFFCCDGAACVVHHGGVLPGFFFSSSRTWRQFRPLSRKRWIGRAGGPAGWRRMRRRFPAFAEKKSPRKKTREQDHPARMAAETG